MRKKYEQLWARQSQLSCTPLGKGQFSLVVTVCYHWLNGHKWASSRSWCWTGKLGMLQSTGLQRVGHNWMTGLNYFFAFNLQILLANFSTIFLSILPYTHSKCTTWKFPNKKTIGIFTKVYLHIDFQWKWQYIMDSRRMLHQFINLLCGVPSACINN